MGRVSSKNILRAFPAAEEGAEASRRRAPRGPPLTDQLCLYIAAISCSEIPASPSCSSTASGSCRKDLWLLEGCEHCWCFSGVRKLPGLRHRRSPGRCPPGPQLRETSLQLAVVTGHQSQQVPGSPHKGLSWCQGTEESLEGSGREPRAPRGRLGGGVYAGCSGDTRKNTPWGGRSVNAGCSPVPCVCLVCLSPQSHPPS